MGDEAMAVPQQSASSGPAALRSGVGADGPVERIRVQGSTLAVKRWGAGPPVLALHAVGHGSGDYAALAARIADRFELIALDWPGHGHSPDDGGPVLAGRYARLLPGVCDTLRLERPIVIGNSIGGAAALIAAAEAPGRFAGLVLCNAGGLAPLDSTARAAIGLMTRFFQAGARGASWFPAAFGLYYRACVLSRGPAAAQRRRIVAAGRELAPLLADAWQGFGGADGDLRHLVPQVIVPVWLAWARGDRFVSWARSKAAVRHFPDHRVTLFRGSHAAFLEDPDDFARGFAEFAASLRAYNTMNRTRVAAQNSTRQGGVRRPW